MAAGSTSQGLKAFSMARTGPLLVGLGAALWATDALFRYPVLDQLGATVIVFYEHLLATALLLTWVFLRKADVLNLRPGEWLGAILIGIGGSALATVFFTASFRYVNPSVTILLQKLQPILCVFFSVLLLRERPPKNFLPWAALALAAGVVVSFPSIGQLKEINLFDSHQRGIAYALIAALLWALSTVAGKAMLHRLPSSTVTFWRFVFGLSFLTILIPLGGKSFQFDVAFSPKVLESLAYMSLVPGLLAVYCYYQGLKRTPASTATFVELVFPVAAVALNTWVLGMPLNPIQIGASAVLLFAVTRISLL